MWMLQSDINLLPLSKRISIWYQQYRIHLWGIIASVIVGSVAIIIVTIYQYNQYIQAVTAYQAYEKSEDVIKVHQQVMHYETVRERLLTKDASYHWQRKVVHTITDAVNEGVLLQRLQIRDGQFTIIGRARENTDFEKFKQILQGRLKGGNIHGTQDHQKPSEGITFHMEGNVKSEPSQTETADKRS